MSMVTRGLVDDTANECFKRCQVIHRYVNGDKRYRPHFGMPATIDNAVKATTRSVMLKVWGQLYMRVVGERAHARMFRFRREALTDVIGRFVRRA